LIKGISGLTRGGKRELRRPSSYPLACEKSVFDKKRNIRERTKNWKESRSMGFRGRGGRRP